MTYNPSIPQPTDLISNSEAQLLANFGQLNTQFGVAHVAFNTGSGNGDCTHKKITFDNAPAEPTPAGTVSNIFPLLVGSNQELFFKNASTEYNGSGKIRLTGPSTIPNTANTKGYLTLPGGVLFQWVYVDTTSGSGSATWSTPFITAIFALTLAPNVNATHYIPPSGSLTTVTVNRSGSGGSHCWVMAVGV